MAQRGTPEWANSVEGQALVRAEKAKPLCDHGWGLLEEIRVEQLASCLSGPMFCAYLQRGVARDTTEIAQVGGLTPGMVRSWLEEGMRERARALAAALDLGGLLAAEDLVKGRGE